MTEKFLNANQLCVGYNGVAIVPPVTFSIARGELWALLGPNGAGKTTLLKTLLRLIPKISGSIEWGAGEKVGYVPQRSTIDESVPGRVKDLVALGLDHNWSLFNPFYVRRHKDAVAEALSDANLNDLADQPFASLSEGQKQRVLMARALAASPKLLILDEPTSAMDMLTETSILQLLVDFIHKRGVGILMVSHNLPKISKFATHAIVVDREEQRVIAGPIDEIAYDDQVVQLFGNVLQKSKVA